MNDIELDAYLRGFLGSRTTLTIQSGKSFHKDKDWWEFRLEPVIVFCGRFDSINIINILKEKFKLNSKTKRKVNSFQSRFRNRQEISAVISFLGEDIFNEAFSSKISIFREICKYRWSEGGKRNLFNVLKIIKLKEQLNPDGYKKKESVFLSPEEILQCFIDCYGTEHFKDESENLPEEEKKYLYEILQYR